MKNKEFNIKGATEAEIKIYCLNIVATHYVGVAGVAIDDIIKEAEKLAQYIKP